MERDEAIEILKKESACINNEFTGCGKLHSCQTCPIFVTREQVATALKEALRLLEGVKT